MSGTYSDLLYHILWSTHQRRSWLVAELRPRTYQYVGGIVRDCGAELPCMGGVEDHVHILVRGRTDATIADLMRNVKSRSSGWIHDTFAQLKGFAWQEGYAAFSVSASQKRRVMNYIESQEEHHKARSFRDELVAFLQRHQVKFDEQYLD